MKSPHLYCQKSFAVDLLGLRQYPIGHFALDLMDLALRPNVVHHLLVEQQLLILDPRFRFLKQLEGHFGTYPPIRATLHHHKRHIVLFELVSALF